MKNEILHHLQKAKTMQLATVSDGHPWVCTVYFVADDEMNLYWLSWPDRRHSQDILSNPLVAVAIQIKAELPVIGIQAEGRAQNVNDLATVESTMENYVKKYGSGKNFYDRFKSGNNTHQMYKFIPKSYVLFDEVNDPDNPRKTLDVNH